MHTAHRYRRFAAKNSPDTWTYSQQIGQTNLNTYRPSLEAICSSDVLWPTGVEARIYNFSNTDPTMGSSLMKERSVCSACIPLQPGGVGPGREKYTGNSLLHRTVYVNEILTGLQMRSWPPHDLSGRDGYMTSSRFGSWPTTDRVLFVCANVCTNSTG